MSSLELPPDNTNTNDATPISEKPSYKITERKFDNYVEPRGLSPDDGYRHFHITPEEVEPYGVEFTTKSEEVIRSGTSVNLVERAFRLSNALDAYLRSSKLNGFVYKKEFQGRLDEIPLLIRGESRRRSKGNAEFFKAFGGLAMIGAGYDTEYVKSMAQEDADKFIDRYTGVANEKNRAKLRKILKQQTK